jgi:hypothetical protein
MSRNTIIGIIVLMIFCLSSAIFMTTREDDKKISLVLGPSEPVGPIEPTESTEPIETTESTEPVGPIAPTEPIETAESTEPVGPIETTESTESTEPIETTESTEPVGPIAPTEPIAPIETTESTESTELNLSGVNSDDFNWCYVGQWVNSGSCSSKGKQSQTRSVVGITCSDDLITEREIDCCYQTEWVGDNICDSDGKTKQTREAAGSCDDLSTEKEIDCSFYGPWILTDTCGSNGKIIEERTVTRGGNITKEERDTSTDCTPWAVTDRCSSRGKLIEERTLAGTTEEQDSSTDCCYQTEWVENCRFNRITTNYKLIQTREAVGSCDDLNTRRSAYVGLCEISSNDRCGVGTGRLDGRCKDKDACCSEDGYCGTEYCGVYGQQVIYNGDNKISWAYS